MFKVPNMEHWNWMIVAEHLEDVFSWSNIQIGRVFASHGHKGIKTTKQKLQTICLDVSMSNFTREQLLWKRSNFFWTFIFGFHASLQGVYVVMFVQ